MLLPVLLNGKSQIELARIYCEGIVNATLANQNPEDKNRK